MDKTAKYYDSNNADEKVMTFLEKKGGQSDTYQANDIAAVSSFHLRGLSATVSLAASIDIPYGSKILDVGSGPGGTSRYLSETFSAQVIGLDLTYAFSKLAKKLSEKAKLSDSTRFVCASALDIPFGSETFDIIWLEHVQMNIRDKVSLVAELYRVLKPGGQLVIYEVFQAGTVAPEYPLPWADKPDVSFLISPGQMKQFLEAEGYIILKWHDCHEGIFEWVKNIPKKQPVSETPVTGVNLLMGDRAGEKVKHLIDAVIDSRLVVIEGVAKKK